jgi:hypothetical protein
MFQLVLNERKGNGMLIKNTKDTHLQKIKAVVYSISGGGKTSLAKTLPHDKTFVVNAESGLLSLQGTSIDYVDLSHNDKGELLAPVDRLKRLREVMEFLRTDEAKKKYDNVVVDSLSEIGDVIEEYFKSVITDKAKVFEVWGKIGESQVTVMRSFRDMPEYNVFFLCLEDIQKDDQSRRFYGPALPGNLAKDALMPTFDLVFRLVVDNDGTRYLQTQALANVKAKDRSGKLAPQEPPHLGNLLTKISYKEEKKKEEKKNENVNG